MAKLYAGSIVGVTTCALNDSMSPKFDIVKTIEEDEDVPDFSENSDEEEEVCVIFLGLFSHI